MVQIDKDPEAVSEVFFACEGRVEDDLFFFLFSKYVPSFAVNG
jgi:hypothetical protein